MKVFRAKHDNVPESPVRTLYGRKGNLLLLPLDVCVLLAMNGSEEFRPIVEAGRLIAAPVLEAGGGRIGLVAQCEWPPRADSPVDPIVVVQLAPSAVASVKGVEDLRVIASQCEESDRVFLGVGGERREGVLRTQQPDWHPYPDATHRVQAHRVQFDAHLERTDHGSAVRLETGELLGMLIATQNQPDGSCRALVYPA